MSGTVHAPNGGSFNVSYIPRSTRGMARQRGLIVVGTLNADSVIAKMEPGSEQVADSS
jgi:hypothetical protein